MRGLLAVLLLISSINAVHAATDVPMGAIFPPDNQASRAAVATALSIINDKHEPIPLLMGQGGGLDRLDGAKLREIDGAADNPTQAEAEAERLVTADHVVALMGGGASDQDAAIRRVAMRHAIPYISLDPSPAPVDGLTWGFNLSPTDAMLSLSLFQFLHDQADAIDRKVQTLGLVYEDRPAIVALSDIQRKLADDAGLQRSVQLNLRPDATGLVTEVETIVEKQPDAIIATLGAGNAILLVRSLAERHALPLLLGQGAGFAAPAFSAGLGSAADGVFRTASLAPDAVAARPGLLALEAGYQARAGSRLDAQAAQVMTAVLLLADVVNRAGSVKPLDLRAALMATDVSGDKLPMAWQGIRFDDSGQNVLATPVIEQMQGGSFRVVAPAELAAAKPVFPAK